MGRGRVRVEDDLEPAISEAAEQEAVLAYQLEGHHQPLPSFLKVDQQAHGPQARGPLAGCPQRLLTKFSRNAEGVRFRR